MPNGHWSFYESLHANRRNALNRTRVTRAFSEANIELSHSSDSFVMLNGLIVAVLESQPDLYTALALMNFISVIMPDILLYARTNLICTIITGILQNIDITAQGLREGVRQYRYIRSIQSHLLGSSIPQWFLVSNNARSRFGGSYNGYLRSRHRWGNWSNNRYRANNDRYRRRNGSDSRRNFSDSGDKGSNYSNNGNYTRR